LTADFTTHFSFEALSANSINKVIAFTKGYRGKSAKIIRLATIFNRMFTSNVYFLSILAVNRRDSRKEKICGRKFSNNTVRTAPLIRYVFISSSTASRLLLCCFAFWLLFCVNSSTTYFTRNLI